MNPQISIKKHNFDYHNIRNCDYYPTLVCYKFDFDLGVAACRGNAKFEPCFWLPLSIPKNCSVSISRRGA